MKRKLQDNGCAAEEEEVPTCVREAMQGEGIAEGDVRDNRPVEVRRKAKAKAIGKAMASAKQETRGRSKRRRLRWTRVDLSDQQWAKELAQEEDSADGADGVLGDVDAQPVESGRDPVDVREGRREACVARIRELRQQVLQGMEERETLKARLRTSEGNKTELSSECARRKDELKRLRAEGRAAVEEYRQGGWKDGDMTIFQWMASRCDSREGPSAMEQ